MEHSLLFEHLVCDWVDCEYYHGIGSSLFNACLCETESYTNGINVGRASMLACVALRNMLAQDNLSKSAKTTINLCIDSIEKKRTFDALAEAIQKLSYEKLLF